MPIQERLGEFHGADLFTVPGKLEGFRRLIQSEPFSKHFDGVCAYIMYNSSVVPLDIQVARLNHISVPCPRGPVADIRFNPAHFYEIMIEGLDDFVRLAGVRKLRTIHSPIPEDWTWRILAALLACFQIALLLELLVEVVSGRKTNLSR